MTLRHVALGLAALVYACASSPTPDAPGWPEYVILLLLAVAAVPPRWPRREGWVAPLAALMLYGLTVPVFIALFAGAGAGDMLRDLVAFAALGLPLVYAALFPSHDARAQNLLLAMLLGIGLVFSCRYLFGINLPFGGLIDDPGLLYLANSPLVSFAAAWLLLMGCFALRPLWAVPCVALSVIPVLAMAGMMQRATLALLAIAWLGFFVSTLIRSPARAAVLALGLALLLAVFWPFAEKLATGLYDKTMQVGWNARGAELAALLSNAEGSILQTVFGAGWGSLMKSPAVGDMWVRFSHALLTSLLWKAGWLGLLLGMAAMVNLALAAWRRLRGDGPALAALLLPLVPAMVLYGSYKSFCFGLLLLGLARLQWTKPEIRC